jgi:hypothetical protein
VLYLKYVAHSPRLLLQLLLMLLLAGLIGGTGLIGLQTSRTAITTTSTVKMPALVHLLDAERNVAQSDYYGMRAFAELEKPDQAQQDLAAMRAQGAAAVASFGSFEASLPPSALQRRSLPQIEALFRLWSMDMDLSRMLTSASLPSPMTLRAMKG